MLRSVNSLLLDTLNVAGKLLFIVCVIVVIVCLAALVVLWIVDELDDRHWMLNALWNKKRSVAVTANAADVIIAQYYAEHNRAEAAEEKSAQGLRDAAAWDKQRQAHIKALENQLRENGIEPIRWENLKFERKVA